MLGKSYLIYCYCLRLRKQTVGRSDSLHYSMQSKWLFPLSFDLAATALSWRKFSKEEPSCILACPPVKDSTSPNTFYIKVPHLIAH